MLGLCLVSFEDLLILGIGFIIFATIFWFFSTRRSLSLYIFTVDKEEYDETDKMGPKDIVFKKVLRNFSFVFILIAIVSLILAMFIKK